MIKNKAIVYLVFIALMAFTSPALAAERLSYGKDAKQFGELWLPSGEGPFKVVVIIHGGCWQSAYDLSLMDDLSGDLSKNGVAVWNIEYRSIGNGGGYPQTYNDVSSAIDYLNEIKAKYNLDLATVTAVGHSAGGHLALWAAARKNLKKDDELYVAKALPIYAAVTLSGINDLKYFHDVGQSCGGAGTIDEITGAKTRKSADVYSNTSPAAMLPIGVKQIIISGSIDQIVKPDFSHSYAMKAKEAGDDDVEDFGISDAGHFEMITATSHAWGNIKEILLELINKNERKNP